MGEENGGNKSGMNVIKSGTLKAVSFGREYPPSSPIGSRDILKII